MDRILPSANKIDSWETRYFSYCKFHFPSILFFFILFKLFFFLVVSLPGWIPASMCMFRDVWLPSNQDSVIHDRELNEASSGTTTTFNPLGNISNMDRSTGASDNAEVCLYSFFAL